MKLPQLLPYFPFRHLSSMAASWHAPRMSTVTRADVSTLSPTQRLESPSGITIWNHHTLGLRRLASGFPAVDRLHDDWLDLGPTFRDAQSIRRSPSLCLNIVTLFTPHSKRHTALYLSPRDVSVRVRPPPLCHQPEVRHSRCATGQQSGFNNPLDCQ